MTDTQAAERIWTDGHDYWAHPTHKDDKTEYIRADLVEAMEAENQRLRFALRIIAGYGQCLDNLMSNSDIARAALRSTETSHDD